jgi:gluconate 2-dehydrogenase gamma chain
MESSRRQFLIASATGLSSLWLSSQWPAIMAAQEYAQHAAAGTITRFRFFSPEDAVEIEAVAAQIIPSTETPGAREARVVHFIDRALTSFANDKQRVYVDGVRELESRTRAIFPATSRFSWLSESDQTKVLTSIEKTEFFETVRLHTIMGFLSNPEYGGNYAQAGWKAIGFEDRMAYEPPFGYYDDQSSTPK